jgi:hypothetical protein
MDGNREAQIIEYARRGRLFIMVDRSFTTTVGDHSFAVPVHQGGATAAEVNEMIDVGKLTMDTAGRSRGFNGYMHKKVTVTVR